MVTALGRITSLDIPEIGSGDWDNPEGATLTVEVEEPNDGSLVVKVYPAAIAKEFATGLCRIMVDAG